MASIPTIMKASQMVGNGGVDVLECREIPVPSLSDGQVLIKNEYSGINFIDIYFRTGLYKVPSFPWTLGTEASGYIIATHPSVSSLDVGNRVVYMAAGPSGTYAEFTAVDASKVVAIPDDVSNETAAAICLQGLTAWTMITEAANVQPDQWCLVHAAAGGVGILLVQMLKHIGAKIVATASTEEKLTLARNHGAASSILSDDEDLVKHVMEITNGHGIDVIFDGVGKDTFNMDLQIIANKGRLISFGNASGAVPPINILALGPKNVVLMRPLLAGFISARQDLARYTTELFELVSAGKIEARIHKLYSLEDAAQAHLDLESRKTTGKLLLKFD